MQKSAPPAPLFKDFEKPIKDLFSVGFADADSWKVEVKDKHPSENVFYVNPTATSSAKGNSLQVELGFKATCGGAVKVVGKPGENNFKDSKWTASYVLKGQNIAMTLQKKKNVGEHQCPCSYTIAHDGTVPLPSAISQLIHRNNFSAHETLTEETLDVGFGIPVARHCILGIGSLYNMKTKKCNWQVASKYHHPKTGIDVFVQTAALKKVTASMKVPVKCLKCPIQGHNIPLVLGAKCTYDMASKKHSGEAVVELKCPAAATSTCPLANASTLKIKVNDALNVVVAYTLKASKGWTASVSVDKNLKAGLTFTHA